MKVFIVFLYCESGIDILRVFIHKETALKFMDDYNSTGLAAKYDSCKADWYGQEVSED